MHAVIENIMKIRNKEARKLATDKRIMAQRNQHEVFVHRKKLALAIAWINSQNKEEK